MANTPNPMISKLLAPLQPKLAKPSWESENSNSNSNMLPSDHFGKPILLRGPERGGIFLTSDDNALAKQIEQLHKPDARYVNVRPLFHLVEEIIHRGSPNVEGPSLVLCCFFT